MDFLNQVKFTTVDVITHGPFQGNQLAMVHDIESILSQDLEQAIMWKSGFSKTVFLRNASRVDQARRLDISAPYQESHSLGMQ